MLVIKEDLCSLHKKQRNESPCMQACYCFVGLHTQHLIKNCHTKKSLNWFPIFECVNYQREKLLVLLWPAPNFLQKTCVLVHGSLIVQTKLGYESL